MTTAGLFTSRNFSFGQEQKQQLPNIVIFFLDDSGYGDYEHNGNPVIRTPNISKLKQDGTSFSQFYVTTAACSASRYSLLTGRYPGRSGLGSWVIGPESKKYIHEKEITLAKGLKSKGYATGMFGKWHLGTPNKNNSFDSKSLPLANGFDTWIGTNVSHDYSNAMLIQKDPTGHEPVDGYSIITKNLPSNTKACESLTGRYANAAVDFIKANKDKPFFAYIAHNMPHLGIHASESFKGRSRRGLLGDVMEEIDDSVGKVRKTLEDCGITDNTLIIFSSDNGPWIRFRNTEKSKYGEARMHVGYATPFRDGKGSTWEGGHRVPGIFCWPGKIPANRNLQIPASTLDILPTIFNITGINLPTDRTIDGCNIGPLLMSDKPKEKFQPFRFFYSYHDNKPSAIRKGPWKLHIRIGSQTGDNYGFTASREKPLLFQVEQDLSERIDRAAEHPEIVKELLTDLENFQKQLQTEGTFWDKS
ncbi:MAG: sulfatase [Phycisphaerae bacterium]|nr:sulfatase [Phycisphaerae bacterium]